MIMGALLGTALSVSGAPTRDITSYQPDDESVITVQHRFSGIVCAGVCIDSDLSVRHDGAVEYRVRYIGRPWKTHRYRVSKEQIEEFWRAYRVIRPTGLKGPVGECDQGSAIIDFEIHWNESFGSANLLACRDPEVWRAYVQGFHALRISPVTGERLTARQAEILR
jgi:hypothetical protein